MFLKSNKSRYVSSKCFWSPSSSNSNLLCFSAGNAYWYVLSKICREHCDTFAIRTWEIKSDRLITEADFKVSLRPSRKKSISRMSRTLPSSFLLGACSCGVLSDNQDSGTWQNKTAFHSSIISFPHRLSSQGAVCLPPCLCKFSVHSSKTFYNSLIRHVSPIYYYLKG